MVKTSSILLLALPLVCAKMRGVSREAEEKFPVARQLMGNMGGGSGGCSSGVSGGVSGGGNGGVSGGISGGVSDRGNN